MKARFFDKLENKVFMIIVLTALATGAAVFTITSVSYTHLTLPTT